MDIIINCLDAPFGRPTSRRLSCMCMEDMNSAANGMKCSSVPWYPYGSKTTRSLRDLSRTPSRPLLPPAAARGLEVPVFRGEGDGRTIWHHRLKGERGREGHSLWEEMRRRTEGGILPRVGDRLEEESPRGCPTPPRPPKVEKSKRKRVPQERGQQDNKGGILQISLTSTTVPRGSDLLDLLVVMTHPTSCAMPPLFLHLAIPCHERGGEAGFIIRIFLMRGEASFVDLLVPAAQRLLGGSQPNMHGMGGGTLRIAAHCTKRAGHAPCLPVSNPTGPSRVFLGTASDRKDPLCLLAGSSATPQCMAPLRGVAILRTWWKLHGSSQGIVLHPEDCTVRLVSMND